LKKFTGGTLSIFQRPPHRCVAAGLQVFMAISLKSGTPGSSFQLRLLPRTLTILYWAFSFNQENKVPTCNNISVCRIGS
jgi:hypothetical protein